MLQPLEELENFYQQEEDPWSYETTPDDAKRRSIIVSEIPERSYGKVLDIGCGHGFVTRELPGEDILGVDISNNAIQQAMKLSVHQSKAKRLRFLNASIFELDAVLSETYDLVVITGVLYSQYIGESKTLVRQIVDKLLNSNGVLVCSHINDWYSMRFPYLLLESYFFEYREYTQRLEVYVK
ncbi:MAG: class I SAM-dependent methyltransferase [Leptolyngbyaceae cyanobacterium CSU_1_4]|nr:class I SAM-dependent methyltransferase [Leptolyngbyaceae cyanobacterium CSU_1_4]